MLHSGFKDLCDVFWKSTLSQNFSDKLIRPVYHLPGLVFSHQFSIISYEVGCMSKMCAGFIGKSFGLWLKYKLEA